MLASAHVCLREPVTFRCTCAHPRRPVTEGVFGICSFLGMAFSLFARQHRKILFTAHGRMAEGATELRVHAGRPPPPTAGCSGHPALCAPLRSSTLLTAGADPGSECHPPHRMLRDPEFPNLSSLWLKPVYPTRPGLSPPTRMRTARNIVSHSADPGQRVCSETHVRGSSLQT